MLCGVFNLGSLNLPPLSLNTLRDHLRINPDANRQAMAYRIAMIVEHLHSDVHSQVLVHGNINMDDVCIAGDTVLLAGLAHCGIEPVIAQPSSPGGCYYAPPGYITSLAPELVTNVRRTRQTDVYAFGMLVFEMYAGHAPFANLRPGEPLRASAMAQLGVGKRPQRSDITRLDFTDRMWELVTACWAQDPAARPSMANVCARLAAAGV
ncbi:kinase-like protein [Auricularia subglabra TFB-10046 SS5]|nr:kinase-like protein [Auricularia subglabra TFB-10046 SS5]